MKFEIKATDTGRVNLTEFKLEEVQFVTTVDYVDGEKYYGPCKIFNGLGKCSKFASTGYIIQRPAKVNLWIKIKWLFGLVEWPVEETYCE